MQNTASQSLKPDWKRGDLLIGCAGTVVRFEQWSTNTEYAFKGSVVVGDKYRFGAVLPWMTPAFKRAPVVDPQLVDEGEEI